MNQWISVQCDRLVSWLKSEHLVPWMVGNGCCQTEINRLKTSTYSWERLGIQNIASEPFEADLLLVSGWINNAIADELRAVHNMLHKPCSVMAIGACAISGSPFFADSDPILAHHILPVDIFVPGCPPRPETLLSAIIQIKELRRPQASQRNWIHDAIKTSD